MTARRVECRCDDNMTCSDCLREAPVYFYTPLTATDAMRRQIEKERAK